MEPLPLPVSLWFDFCPSRFCLCWDNLPVGEEGWCELSGEELKWVV